MRLSIIIIKFIIFITIIVPPALALESTPSADIKSKLEELKKEIASKAAILKAEVNRKLKDKAYSGEVKSKSDTSLTLAADSGPKIVSINEDTVFESNIPKQKDPLKISVGSYVAALGDADETGVLTAKKIIILPAQEVEPKSYMWGQIISISEDLITLRNNEFKIVTASLPEGSKTSLNNFVILTGTKDKNGVFHTDFTFTIPQDTTPKPASR